MLTHGLNGSEYSTLLLLLAACDPLVAMDSRLIDSANTGRPILQGAALSFDGATQNAESPSLITSSDTFIHASFWLKPNEPNFAIFFSILHSSADDIRLVSSSNLFRLDLDDGSVSSISTTESTISSTWRFVEIYVADGDNWIEFDGVRYSGAHPFSLSTLTDGRLALGAKVGGTFPATCSIIDARITSDSVNEHWELRDNGLSALTSGTDLTLVGSPVSVTDNTIPVDPANERGFSGRMWFDGASTVTIPNQKTTLPLTLEMDVLD